MSPLEKDLALCHTVVCHLLQFLLFNLLVAFILGMFLAIGPCIFPEPEDRRGRICNVDAGRNHLRKEREAGLAGLHWQDNYRVAYTNNQ